MSLRVSIRVVISSTCITNTVRISNSSPSLLSACEERLAPIFHGCPFQKSQQTCHKKGQRDLNNIKDHHSLFSARLYHPQKKQKKETSIYSSPPQVTLQTSPTVHCNGRLSSLTESWHLYYLYSADWREIYWQRVPHRKQGGTVSEVGVMGI